MTDATDLKGLWQGSYSYSSSAEIGETPFKARFGGQGNTLSGLIMEVHFNTGDQVKAEIEGAIENDIVRFTKQYVGAGSEYKRVVHYEGQLSPDGGSISGTWSLPDDSGTFVMQRSV
ncbi:MAG: hypothetical protein ABJN35_08355 [Erythrobacter sp.]